MTILDEIVKYKRIVELPHQKKKFTPASVQAKASLTAEPKDFVATLQAIESVALIAEIKKASPSKGLLCHNFDPLELAGIYAANGAVAISVLTDAKYFQGKLEYLTQIRHKLNRADRPALLRKDFIIDPYQVYEARAAGADALLLIAAVLTDKEMNDLLTLSCKLSLSALIEVHNKTELERVLPLQPRLIGVNNRNLHNFSVDLNICIELRQYVPEHICFVAESGIRTSADIVRLSKEGIDAVLVGEALVKAKDTEKKIRELLALGL